MAFGRDGSGVLPAFGGTSANGTRCADDVVGDRRIRRAAGGHAQWIGDAGGIVDRMLRNVVHGRRLAHTGDGLQ